MVLWEGGTGGGYDPDCLGRCDSLGHGRPRLGHVQADRETQANKDNDCWVASSYCFYFGGAVLWPRRSFANVARRCLSTFGRLCEQGRSRMIAAAHS